MLCTPYSAYYLRNDWHIIYIIPIENYIVSLLYLLYSGCIALLFSKCLSCLVCRHLSSSQIFQQRCFIYLKSLKSKKIIVQTDSWTSRCLKYSLKKKSEGNQPSARCDSIAPRILHLDFLLLAKSWCSATTNIRYIKKVKQIISFLLQKII